MVRSAARRRTLLLANKRATRPARWHQEATARLDLLRPRRQGNGDCGSREPGIDMAHATAVA